MTHLLRGATSAATGSPISNRGGARTFQAVVTGSGALTATVEVEVSNNGTHFLPLGTIGMTGTNAATDGFAADAPWLFLRARVTAISGTGASIDVIAGS